MFTSYRVGLMVNAWWHKIPQRFIDVKLDAYQLMPNHLHGIIVVGGIPCVAPQIRDKHMGLSLRTQQTLFHTIQWFKTMTTNEYIYHVKHDGWARFNKKLLQRSYYDNIIRNNKDYLCIKEYIYNNPLNWEKDEENLNRLI